MSLNKEETDKIYQTITANGCREMNEERFYQAVNEALSIANVVGSYNNYSYNQLSQLRKDIIGDLKDIDKRLKEIDKAIGRSTAGGCNYKP